jgi:hypothetical protein
LWGGVVRGKKDKQNVLIGVHSAYLWLGEEVVVCTNDYWMEDVKSVGLGRGENGTVYSGELLDYHIF